ncbi:hypothetical protein BAE44_0023162 [Dichanthelium oligosanthes]|uniref:HTH 3-helical bundle domain-containing protein n=1 Tax=Dichanthelium oligosanthes TaxID=888268 RepID=A0A1E5USE5_9POAL|nr:hypothetical protein BAE44_0023162 [Dichanthelium oligosanthes]
MDPTKSNGEWSASEIKMVKSFIASYDDNNNSYADDMNKRHNDIVNEVQIMFPYKEKHQVIRLYVDLMVEMIQSGIGDGSYHSAAVRRDLVNNNFEIPVEDPTMDSMRVAQEAPHRQPTPQMERPHNTMFWTKAEHSYADDMNKRHNDIISEVQAMFPSKEKHQVILLYVDLMVEMMQSSTGGSSYPSMAPSRGLVNNNFEIPVEADATMDNMMVTQEAPRRHPTP